MRTKLWQSQIPLLGISLSLTLVSVLKMIYQGTVVEKGSVWQNGPSCAFQGEHRAFPSAALFDACQCVTQFLERMGSFAGTK